MATLIIGESRVTIPTEALVTALLAGMPDAFVSGAGLTGRAALVRTAIKAAIPLGLAALADEAEKRGITPPNLKSPACRANNIAYTLDYVLRTLASAADSHVWIADGREEGGSYVVSGFHAAPTVAPQEPADRSADDASGVASDGADLASVH